VVFESRSKVRSITRSSETRKVIFALPIGKTLVGRALECDLRLSDSQVSRRHCRFVLTEETLKVVDLSSTNGTIVNDRPVPEAVLNDADRVSLGRINLTVRSGVDQTGATYSDLEVNMSEQESLSDPDKGGGYSQRDDTAAGGNAVTGGERSQSQEASDHLDRQIARYEPVPSALPASPARIENVLIPQSPAAQSGGSQRSMWELLRYRRTIISVAMLIAVPAVVGIWGLLEPQYVAVGQVRVRPIIPHLVFKTEESGTIPFYQSYLNTQVGVIRSPSVLQRTLDQPEVQETNWYTRGEPFWRGARTKIERLREDLTVQPRGLTELIDVSMSTASGQESAVIVNAVLDQYIKYLSETSDEGTDMMFRQLAREYQSLQTEVRGREEIIARLRKQLGTGDPKELVSQKRVRLDQTQAALNTVRRALAMAKLREKDLRERLSIGDNPAGKASEGPSVRPRHQDDLEWNRLNLAVKEAQHEVDLASQHLGYAHPRLIALKKQVKFRQELLAAREKQLAEGCQVYPVGQTGSGGVQSTQAGLAFQLEDANWQAKLLSYEEKLLSAELDKQKSSWESTFDRARILDKELAAIGQKRQLCDAVRNRLEQKRMERNVPGSIEVLARAVVPAVPARDRRVVLTLLSLMIGLGAGLGAAFLRAGGDSSIYQVEEFRQTTPAPFLGQLPQVETKADQTPLDDPVLNEGIRMVRTSLLQQLQERGGNVVLVTSAEPGVGKTTVAAMLARSLARCGKRALLVDADLRNPTVADQMGVGGGAGLAEALAGQVDDAEAIRETSNPGLSVLSGGRAGQRIDPELITNGSFAEAIDRWRREYDVVLLDSPPVLPVADTRILARHADGTILVVWAERTRRSELLEAIGSLDLAGGRLWGTVFISPRQKRGYGYNYSYHYNYNQR